MSTIVEFCRVRNEVAVARLASGADEDAPSCGTIGAKAHIAEIILLPRIRAASKERVRKPLKRRFALRSARTAGQR
jgi:hypothetical protein